MRVIRLAGLALLAMALWPSVTEARSAWNISFGYNSGGYCGRGGGLSIGYGYSYGYRPSFVHGGYSRAYCPPTYYAPRYYAPAYCPPPVYYSTPSFGCNDYAYSAPVYYGTPRFNNSSYAYSAPVYYSTPRFSNRSYVSVNYANSYDRGYNYVDRGYSYVDRNYSYCPPAKSYGYSSYYRR